MRKPYPTDLSDAEWKYLEPHMPAPKGHGRPRTHDLREILNATFYLLKSGCQWRLLPTSGPDAGSLDVEGGYPVPVYSFPITTSNPKKNGYRMTTQKRMIKISIEVMRGSTRFKVAAQAESIEEAYITNLPHPGHFHDRLDARVVLVRLRAPARR